MNHTEYLLSDEVASYVFGLGDVNETSDVFGLHYAGLLEETDYVAALGMAFFELPDRDVAHLRAEYIEQYDRLVGHVGTMPKPVCTSIDVSVELKEIDYTLDEYGELARSYVRLEDDRASRMYDFLLTRGMDADDVVYVTYRQLYVSDVLVMRMVMFWLEEPTERAYSRGDERVYAFYAEPGSSLFSRLQDDVLSWMDEQREWYNEAMRD